MSIAPKRRLSLLIDKHIAPLLAAKGFERDRDVFVCDKQSMQWLIELQRSKWNSSGQIDFTFSIGVYVPGLFSTYSGRLEFETRSAPTCCIHGRIGMLDPDHFDSWWSLSREECSEQFDDSIRQSIIDKLVRIAFPFLARFESLNDVAEFLVSARKPLDKTVFPQSHAIAFAYAAILYQRLGLPKEQMTALARAEEEARGSPVEEIVGALCLRMASRDEV
ncbi:MAG: DUF4304 domain-containing protein [Planctomycetales bacterium]